MGSRGGPSFLGGSRPGEPQLFPKGHQSRDRPGAELRQLRRHAGRKKREFRTGCLAHRGQLVSGLVLVGCRPQGAKLSDWIQAFFESKGIDTYGNQFTLDGTQVGNSHSTALVATNAVGSLAATEPRAAKFVEALWNAQIPSGRYRYYDGMCYLMGHLHCAGEFRIWPPK